MCRRLTYVAWGPGFVFEYTQRSAVVFYFLTCPRCSWHKRGSESAVLLGRLGFRFSTSTLYSLQRRCDYFCYDLFFFYSFDLSSVVNKNGLILFIERFELEYLVQWYFQSNLCTWSDCCCWAFYSFFFLITRLKQIKSIELFAMSSFSNVYTVHTTLIPFCEGMCLPSIEKGNKLLWTQLNAIEIAHEKDNVHICYNRMVY